MQYRRAAPSQPTSQHKPVTWRSAPQTGSHAAHGNQKNVKMPHSRAMGKGLFELRPKGREGIGRAFYCFVIGRRIIILHAFIKKTPATPEPELKIARKRIKEVQNG